MPFRLHRMASNDELAGQSRAHIARGLSLLALCLAAAVAGCERFGTSAQGLLRADDPQVLALGKRVYEQHCAACHGARLEGQPDWRVRDAAGLLPAPPHDASGHTWHHPDAVLFEITKYGVARAANLKDYKSAMPAYENVLDDAEIVAVLSWIKAQWPAEIRKQQEAVDAAARARGGK